MQNDASGIKNVTKAVKRKVTFLLRIKFNSMR